MRASEYQPEKHIGPSFPITLNVFPTLQSSHQNTKQFDLRSELCSICEQLPKLFVPSSDGPRLLGLDAHLSCLKH